MYIIICNQINVNNMKYIYVVDSHIITGNKWYIILNTRIASLSNTLLLISNVCWSSLDIENIVTLIN